MKDKTKLVKFYAGLPDDQIGFAPPDAISGVSKADAERLKKAFGIDSIRGMGEFRCYRRAKEIVALADKENEQ